MPKKIGVYILRHPSSGCFYIGSTGDLVMRKGTHLHEFRNNTHYNPRLQHQYNIDPNIVFEFFPTTTREEAFILEQQLINTHLNDPDLCNQSKTSTGRGMAMTQAHRDIISQRHTGKVVSPEIRQRMSAAQKGRIITEEHRAKLSLAHTGKVLSEETKAKISKPVIIDGVHYPSATVAAEALGVVRTTVMNRIVNPSPKWAGWQLKEQSGE